MDKISRIKFYFICCLITLNGLFIGYALGLNSRHVLIVDPNLPKYVKPVPVKPKASSDTTTTTTTETKKTDGKSAAHDGKSAGHTSATGKSTHSDGAKQPGGKPGAKPEAKPEAKTEAKPGAKPASSGHSGNSNHTADHGTPTTKKSGDAASSPTSKVAPTPSKATN